MKYYSEKLNKIFDKPEDLKEAERAYAAKEAEEKEKKAKRAKRAQEVEDAYDNYMKLLKEFIEDYGSYHLTKRSVDDDYISLFNIFCNWPLSH